jgi:hypothetical protein
VINRCERAFDRIATWACRVPPWVASEGSLVLVLTRSVPHSEHGPPLFPPPSGPPGSLDSLTETRVHDHGPSRSLLRRWCRSEWSGHLAWHATATSGVRSLRPPSTHDR